MAYARFIFPTTPANVAKPANVRSICGQTLAEIASVAGVHRENQISEPSNVATLAIVTFPLKGETGTAIAEQYEPKADPNRCHLCGERETADALFIAVLTSRPGTHHWLHVDCHPEHIRRCAEMRERSRHPEIRSVGRLSDAIHKPEKNHGLRTD